MKPDEHTPVFVGGTGRSGTTVLGRMLGEHPAYAVFPVEMKFHCDARGLPGVLDGRVSTEAFKEAMWAWHKPQSDARGLGAVISEQGLSRMLEAFGPSREAHALRASRKFLDTMFGRYATENGAASWVEMTPRNVLHAPALIRLVPKARIVHSLRDGRDVASSLVNLGWQEDLPQALTWWEQRVRRAFLTARKVPPGVIHVVHFDRLASVEYREETVVALLKFLGWGSESSVLDFLEKEMPPERANVGRWSKGLDRSNRLDIEERYDAAIGRLAKVGVVLAA